MVERLLNQDLLRFYIKAIYGTDPVLVIHTRKGHDYPESIVLFDAIKNIDSSVDICDVQKGNYLVIKLESFEQGVCYCKRLQAVDVGYYDDAGNFLQDKIFAEVFSYGFSLCDTVNGDHHTNTWDPYDK